MWSCMEIKLDKNIDIYLYLYNRWLTYGMIINLYNLFFTIVTYFVLLIKIYVTDKDTIKIQY